jgi:hypothetical protein
MSEAAIIFLRAAGSCAHSRPGRAAQCLKGRDAFINAKAGRALTPSLNTLTI